MASSVRVKDHGYDALMKRMRDATKGAKVTVGIHEEEGVAPEGDSGATVAEVAAMHEFGLGQEQRSFVRAYVDANEAQLNDDMRKIGQAVVSGQLSSTQQGLERFGLKVVGGMQTFISDGQVQPADKPATIARKGSSTPLLDDGILRSSITHKVEK